MTNFEEELNQNGVLIYTNKGVSMMPLLRQGKDVMIINKKQDGFKKNDAVLFKRDNGQYILHRITKILDGGYFIIGDNCELGEFVRNDQMLGILTSIKRNGKTISVDDFTYRIYVFFVPLRRLIKKILAPSYRKIKAFLKRRKK